MTDKCPSKRVWYHLHIWDIHSNGILLEGWSEYMDFFFCCGYWFVVGGRMYSDYIDISQMFNKKE